MTMTNAEWMLKNGYKFENICLHHSGNKVSIDLFSSIDSKCYCIGLADKVDGVGYSDERYAAFCKWLDMEHKEQILDDAEKRYLSKVLEPVRNNVSAICKVCNAYEDREYIAVLGFFGGSNCTFLPDFEPCTMFKGMDADKWYSIEELGL